jgi:hypothetical protein
MAGTTVGAAKASASVARPDNGRLIECVALFSVALDDSLPSETPLARFQAVKMVARDGPLQAALPSTLPMYAFPMGVGRSDELGDSFFHSFSLADDGGRRMVGHCYTAYVEDTAHCLVILSCASFHQSISRFLKSFVRNFPMDRILAPGGVQLAAKMLEGPLPPRGDPLIIHVGAQSICCLHPTRRTLPLCDLNMRMLFRWFEAPLIARLLTALLNERQVIVVSSSISKLTPTMDSALALLYPFEWEHEYVPLLPCSALHYIHAPIPYFIGVPRALLPPVSQLPSEALLFDLDGAPALVEQDGASPLTELPTRVVRKLVLLLERYHKTVDEEHQGQSETDSPINKLRKGILGIWVALLARFTEFEAKDASGFDGARFLRSVGEENEEFLRMLVHTSSFLSMASRRMRANPDEDLFDILVRRRPQQS